MFKSGISLFARFVLILLTFFVPSSIMYYCYLYVNTDVIGTISVILGLILQSSQIFTIGQVLIHKNGQIVDAYLMYFQIAVNSLSLTLSYLIEDKNIMIVSSAGALLNLIQLLLHRLFQEKATKKENDNKNLDHLGEKVKKDKIKLN